MDSAEQIAYFNDMLSKTAIASRIDRENRLAIAHFGSLERALFMGRMFPGRYVLEDRTAYDGTLVFVDPWKRARTIG